MHIGASMIKQTCFSLCALNVGVIVPRILFQSSSCACSNTLDWTPVDALKGCKKNWHCQKSNETLSYLISFSQLWQQIVLLCWRSGFWRQVGEKFIPSFWVPFRSFCPFSRLFTSPWVSSYGGVWSLQGSSHVCISMKLDLFVARHVIERSPPQRIFPAEKLIWKEICATNSIFIIRSQ